MKHSIKFTFSLIFAFVFAFAAQAQNSEWVRIESDNGEFSIEMPKNPTYFYDKDGFAYSNWGNSDSRYSEMQMLNSSDGKTVMSLEIYRVVSPKKGLDLLLERQNTKTQKLENLPKGFSGKESEKSTINDFKNRKDVEISSVSRYIASKTHVYIITIANRGAKTSVFEKFLSSIRFGENQNGNVKISSLKSLMLDDVGFDESNMPNKSSIPSPKSDTTKEDNTQNPTPILILTKPYASYTQAARRNLVSGTIRLRVTFEKDGHVSKIVLITGLQNGLDRNAFFAALRIKFIPEEKDGVLQTVSKPVEYSFSIG